MTWTPVRSNSQPERSRLSCSGLRSSGRGKALAALLLLCLGGCARDDLATAGLEPDAELAAYARCQQAHQPLFSGGCPRLSVENAYRFRDLELDRSLAAGAQVHGFKGALTAIGAPQALGLEKPVTGVLLRPPVLATGERMVQLEIGSYHRPMLEMELGLRFARSLERPPADVAQLRQALGGVVPVVELADLRFVEPAIRGSDLVAANAAAGDILVGLTMPLPGLDLNAVEAKLFRDGQSLRQGQARDVLGDQWRAALLLVRMLMEQGWKPGPGQILITGAMGGMEPALPGRYQVDFGGLGSLEFGLVRSTFSDGGGSGE